MGTHDGKVAVITGANTGIGLETARGLAKQGFSVVMAARNRQKGEAAVEEVKSTCGHDRVSLLDLDLASFASVRAAAAEVKSKHDRLDVLVNNAGLILGDRRTTEEGFEATFGINHLGHFLFTTELLELIESSAPARIVNLASEAHRLAKGLDFDDLMRERRSYQGMPAYGESKLANILFTKALAKRLEGKNVVAHAVHPGVVRTGFAADGDTSAVFSFLVKVAGPFMLTAAKGARTSLHVALSDEAGSKSGLYWASRRVKKPTKFAEDQAAADRLWDVSESLVAQTSQA